MLMLAFCLFSLSSHNAWGRDAFDADYADCPASMRLPAVADLAVTRQDDAGELRIAWRALEADQVAALGDALRYRAQITAIVESPGHARRTRAVPLGADGMVIDELPLGTELAVSVALTGEAYVLSDIATATFGSLMAAPQFCAPFYSGDALPTAPLLTNEPIPKVTGAAQPTAGRFYYLGFGPAFRNSVPAGNKAWFRVGLAHSSAVDLDRVDFAQYRLRVERADAGDVAGFDAATLAGTFYDTRVLHIHAAQDLASAPRTTRLASLHVAARATGKDTVPALFTLRDIFPVTAQEMPHHAVAAPDPRLARWGLARATAAQVADGLFAPGPHAYYDFPGSLFAEDGPYTLTAWAEDADGTRISPERSVTVHIASAAPGASPFVTIDLWEGWTDDCGERQQVPRVSSPCETGAALSDVQKRNYALMRDCNALLAAKVILDPRGELGTWRANNPISAWAEVTVRALDGSNTERVVDLDLSDESLSGSIPPALGDLDQLENLDLAENQLSGSIPPELGNLAQLENLNLSGNELSGSIPPELGNLAQLEHLFLGDWDLAFSVGNELSGSIPPELGNLAQLVTLDLSHNELGGSIPPELGNLAQLQELRLGDNRLSGSIPSVLDNLAQLENLNLSGNELSGSIPSELGNLAQLQELRLGDNELSGSIPVQLGNLTQLMDLWLGDNQLSGSIPPELGNLAQLENLNLSGNELSGSIPPELGNLAQLQELRLGDNELSGSIPVQLGNLTQLMDLWLGDNQLSGSIPPELGNLAQLGRLVLNDNQLSGSIPPELGNLAQLWLLLLDNNRLSGSIPPELGNLAQLHWLMLNDNQLSGSIPPELGNLPRLFHLFLANNQLSGCIPAGLSNAEQHDLSRLNLNYCHS